MKRIFKVCVICKEEFEAPTSGDGLTTIGRKRIAAIQGRINAKKSSLQTA